MIDKHLRQKTITRTSIIGLLANIAFALGKLIAGTISGSIAIINDGINNASDCLSSLATLFGYALSKKKPTSKHPLGFGRVEYMSALIIAGLIIYAGISCLIDSIKGLTEPKELITGSLIAIILTVSIIGKILLGILNIKAGKKVESEALKASGKDAFSDALSTSISAVGLIASKFTTLPVDAVAGIIISICICLSGIDSLKQTLSALLGERPKKSIVFGIREIIAKHPPLKGGYDVILHNYGPERVVGTCHVEVPDSTTTEIVFDAMTAASSEIHNTMGIHITFGMYAVNDSVEEVVQMRYDVLIKLQATNEAVLSIHAFHVHFDKKLVHFDVVVDFTVKSYHELRAQLTKALLEKYPDYTFDFKIEPDYS